MKVVLDTSAFIYLSDFRGFDEILTVQRVVDEVKDMKTTMKMSGLRLKVVEPGKEAIKIIEQMARGTGDLEKMSRTDIEVLAAAKENECVIISDDRNVQNVAQKVGIKYVSISNKKITKLITWKNYCKNCKKSFDADMCPICGTKLSRIPKKSVPIE